MTDSAEGKPDLLKLLALCSTDKVPKVVLVLSTRNLVKILGFIRGLEKYGKVWNKIWSISRLEKAGKRIFFGLLVWKKKLFFQT